jgi:methyltransferase (TIGR00027 family)
MALKCYGPQPPFFQGSRFAQLKGRVKVFEVDHPATQQMKAEQIKKILGQLPDFVTYVPIDFNVETLQKLLAFGYSPRLKTLFIWEGVVCYLTAEAVDQTLEWVLNNSGPGSSIIFDYLYASALTAANKRGEIARMERASRFSGEGLTFGIDEGKVEEYLRSRGYTQITNVTSEELRKAYFTGVNQGRAIAPIYAIVHASVGASDG